MVSPIRYPRSLPPPLPDGYGDSSGETRAFFQPEVGHPRTRQRFRKTPRFFDLRFFFSQTQFDLFFDWFYGALKQGVSLFDIELIDGDENALAWFTGRLIGGYELEVDSAFNYWVAVKFRTTEEPFTDRPESADDLFGINSAEAVNSGALEIIVALRTTSDVAATNTGRLAPPLMRGVNDSGASNTGRLAPFSLLFSQSQVEASNTGKLADVFVCPDYSTVTLSLTIEPYTAPDGDDAELSLTPCEYTAPEVE
jgi:hypothetical protein